MLRIQPGHDSQLKSAAILAVWRGFPTKKHGERRSEGMQRGLLEVPLYYSYMFY
jgi:hypothetical protein